MKRPVKKGGEYTDREEYKALFEYTPVYPDVSFFRESAVTTHEENVFCGEAPPGERQRRRKRKKDKAAHESCLFTHELPVGMSCPIGHELSLTGR